MSTPDELAELKHAARRPTTSTGARQTLGQLRMRWGSPKIAGAPVTVEIHTGHGDEVWRRMDDGSKNESALYEMEAAP